ncbi:hypothetical protein [Streptomyces showdoensis]|uniref:Lipoprotein n=1 Tax=Streptomyces showdoensis TaxID=68268 RepID=A0A2P2GNN0_STREW|nr:hypothetical protein [Streptomyces showdoensis]KKZ72485.1 hypothetical protein VO63_18160 [Streptomyces showdoensis]
MKDAGRRALRTGAVAAAGVALLAGCSSGGGGGGGDGKPSRTATPGASASGTPAASPTPSATPTGPGFTPDPKKAPRDAADAKRLALAMVAGPDDWGPEYAERAPNFSEPGYWPVLDANCEWEAGTTPRTVLYSVTAYSEIPATGGKAPLRVAATVTVHRTESDADWEMAETLEEALRCPDQQLRDGERITELNSLGVPYGTGGNASTIDSVLERGSYVNSAFKGTHFYSWLQTRTGQVTVATVVKGAPGYTESETNTAQIRANVIMQDRVKKQLGVQS